MDEQPIVVEHNPSPAKLDVLYVEDWPIDAKAPATFTCRYDQREMAYILTGDATVTPTGGAPVTLKARDLVIFAKGVTCVWTVHAAMRKHHYRGD